MITPEDDLFLRRALRLAMNGRGHVEPNPMVGCVLVKNSQIIGEGWHAKVGEAHAEPNALSDCKARGNDPAGATAYVTLEPCCHTNKRTPPCAPRLIEAKIARVVLGCLDPNSDVNGNGVAMLRDAGIVVDALTEAATRTENAHGSPSVGVRALDASVFRQLIAAFAGRQQFDIPFDVYTTLKWAESADGRVAGKNGVRTQISNATSSALVHQLRARSAAVVVGINTVLTDDPMLNVRGINVDRQPNRVVLDHDLRLPVTSKLVTSIKERGSGYVIALCSERTYRDSPRVAELQAFGVEVNRLDDLPPKLAMEVNAAWDLSTNRCDILVEPGPTLAKAFLPDADRLWVFRSPTKIQGGPSAPRAAEIPAHYLPTGTLNVAGDTLTEYLNIRSGAFFAAVPSADFVLAAESVARAAN